MRAGKLLLTAGFLFGLTVAANGAEATNPGKANVKIEILTPLTVEVGDIVIGDGIYLSTEKLEDLKGTSTVTVTGGSATKSVTLSAPTINLTNSTVTTDDEMTVSFSFTDYSGWDFTSGDKSETTTITANIDSVTKASTNIVSGLYEGTVTVTAAYN